MADIDIVPKKRSSIAWLWIVLALVAVVLVMWMMSGSRTRTTRNLAGGDPVAMVAAVDGIATS